MSHPAVCNLWHADRERGGREGGTQHSALRERAQKQQSTFMNQLRLRRVTQLAAGAPRE